MAAVSSAIKQLAAQEAEQLSPLEAAHVHAVLQSAIDKLSLLAAIIVDPQVQARELTQSVGDEISRMIDEQKQLEQRFQELIAAQPALRALPNKANLQGNQLELQEVSEALRQATKQLCRNLKDNPNVAENMAKVAGQREVLQQLLSSTLDSLDEFGTVQPIIEARLAAEQAEADMHEMIEAEKSATAMVKSLKSDLATEKQQHEDQTRERRHAVAELKEQLRHEKLQLAVEGRFHKKDLAAANQTSRRLQDSQLESMQKQLAVLHQQINIERSVHAAAVDFLSGKASGLQDDSAAWLSRREEDARAKERELEVLRAKHAHDLERLAEAEARLRDELAAKDVRDAKAQEEAEDAAAEKELQARRLAAAIKIQAAWRGYKARQEIKGGKAKGKKSGSAKAKKKK